MTCVSYSRSLKINGDEDSCRRRLADSMKLACKDFGEPYFSDIVEHRDGEFLAFVVSIEKQ